jgi:uncharacterized protein YukE
MKSNKEIKGTFRKSSIKTENIDGMMIIETVLNRLISIQKTKEGKQQLKKFYANHKPIMIITLTEIMKETSNQYNQKIKELEHEIDRLKSSKRWYSEEQIGEFHTQINKQSEEINQLKSKLNSQTGKIKERIKELEIGLKENPDLIGEYLSRISELKSLLESEKEVSIEVAHRNLLL